MRASWVVLAVAAAFLWPIRFGGATAFAVVAGSSMEPTYHAGDVLLVRKSDAPTVGEVAVYRVPRGVGAGRLIVHRVVAVTADGRFELRGDHKDTSDDLRIRANDVVGRPVANLGPLPATALRWLPALALAVICLTVGWYLWPPAIRPLADPSWIDADEALRRLAGR